MTELTERVRTDDPWLFQLQNEIRHGAFTETSYNFLTGKPTKVPGSWLTHASGGAPGPLCDKILCSGLARQAAKAPTHELAAIFKRECQICEAERRSRCRLLKPEEPAEAAGKEIWPELRLDKEEVYVGKFACAPSIFPNNDIKYHVNKKRGETYAQREKKGIIWVPASDRPHKNTLRAKPNLCAEKMQWLKRHDKDCGGLYGMLMLVEGMPIALTDHIDRNPENNY